MDPTTYQQMMAQALMGSQGAPGVSQSSFMQNPTSGYGASFLTGNPTVAGGMLGSSPYQSINPMSPQGSATMNGYPATGYDPTQLMQPYQNYPGTTPDHADSGGR